jgi:hypothetical protein
MKSAALLLLPAGAHAAGAGVVGDNLLWLALILLSARPALQRRRGEEGFARKT